MSWGSYTLHRNLCGRSWKGVFLGCGGELVIDWCAYWWIRGCYEVFWPCLILWGSHESSTSFQRLPFSLSYHVLSYHLRGRGMESAALYFFKALKTLGIFGGFTFEKDWKQQILVIILGFAIIFQTKMVQHIRKKHPEYAQLPNTLHTPLTTAVISATPAVLTTDSATGETVVVSMWLIKVPHLLQCLS